MILSIDYDAGPDGAPAATVAASYRGIRGWMSDHLPEKRWFTGDPVADWRAAITETVQSGITQISLSSTCDHFVSDCRGIFSWIEDPTLGDAIVRNTPERAMAISAALDQEDAQLDAEMGDEDIGRALMDQTEATNELEDRFREFTSQPTEPTEPSEEDSEDAALDQFFKSLSPFNG